MSVRRYQMEPHDGPCVVPHLRASTGYQYGCRCPRCVGWYVRYWQFAKTKYVKPSKRHRCQSCAKPHPGKYPICVSCMTPFMLRCYKSRLPWDWVRQQIDRASCAICATLINMDADGSSGRHWQVDHDHRISTTVTAKSVREVLCGPCNSKVGHYEATVKAGLLDRMLRYLEAQR